MTYFIAANLKTGPSLIPVEIFKSILKCYDGNNFVTFLNELFGVEITEQLTAK